MAFVKRIRTSLSVTATGGAAQTFYTSAVLAGHIEALRFTSGSMSTNAHLAVTAENSGLSILDCTATGLLPPMTTPPTFTSRVLCRGFPGTFGAFSRTEMSNREVALIVAP